MILMALPGLNVINATPHSTCNVGHGRQRELSGPSDFCVPFTVVDISKCVSLDFKMGRKPLCPNSPANNKAKQKRGKGKKNDDTARMPQPAPKASHQWTPSNMKGTGSSHKNQKIGQWSPILMRDALAEFDYYEERRIWLNLPGCISLEAYRLKVQSLESLWSFSNSPPLLFRLEKSKAQIARDHGLSPSTFGNQTLGRVEGYQKASGGARRPKILSVSKYTFSTDTLVCM